MKNVAPEHTESQVQEIIKYLNSGKKLTGLEALRKFGSLSYTRRISDIRDRIARGQIKRKLVSEWHKLPNGKRIKRYSFA